MPGTTAARRWLRATVPGALAVLVLATQSFQAHAVPSYARQTGQACVACHVSFPELTPYGRYFKLSGYTLGDRQSLPLAMMAEASVSKISKNTDGNGNTVMNRDGSPTFQNVSVFLAGKANDHIGAFIQYTYDNLYGDGNDLDSAGLPRIKGHSGLDNTDIRIAGKYTAVGSQEPDLLYGFTLHNNPTVQDVWNSTPAFGYPFTASHVAPTPAAATVIDGALAQTVAGTGVYMFWDKTVYAEFSNYRPARGSVWGLLSGGQDVDSAPINNLKMFNPYYRLALSHDWGAHSAMIGTFGLRSSFYADQTRQEPADRFTDVGFDAQYQYITDPHTFTAQATYIHEDQHYDATHDPTGVAGPANGNDTLRTLKLKGTYYYQRKYGATLAYAQTSGTTDPFYTTSIGSANGSPNWRSWTAELDYLPIQNVRLLLQYTKYSKFNGAASNYDGNGRNASDNNLLFFDIWVAF